ncbi:P-loop containing nucleoside triphosphate hydrolase protein [Lactifluus subvellereus]|nr:P-loop containing nucleoside triphosphate hydrolase protein [Lactifluus subvellereus]
MQSEPFSFRKTIPATVPGSSTRSNQPVPDILNPASSEPIGGGRALAMTSIETSLAVLKEASALAEKIPYFSPIAGILLQAITMRDEVKLYKEEWDVVMRKLVRVAGRVVNVGQRCERCNLEEKDLPPDLREILQSLQTELAGIEGALKQCTEVGRVKKIILRKELLKKIKQYDVELSNVLQTFHIDLTLDVTPSGLSGSSDIIISPLLQPRSPQVFFGRDAELEEIIHIIFTNIDSRPARIAILGPGGYGKTTLANAVLTHPRIQHHFDSARYFIPCESIFSSGALLVEIAKCLGVLNEGSDASWSCIHAILNEKETIICLDNFESPWDQDGDIRCAVEELLSRITEIHLVTLLITMRGIVRPAQTHWTKPWLAPLKTLTHDAAREIWEEIADEYDDSAEELIKAVDYVPLAVNLLAHLAQATSPALLLKEWNEKQTGLIQMDQTHKLSNLEYSIQLSIDTFYQMEYT